MSSIPLKALTNFTLSYDAAKINGKRITSSDKSVTYLVPIITTADGKEYKNPIIDFGTQMIAYVSVNHKFGIKDEEKTPENLEKAQAVFKRFTRDQIEMYYDAYEGKDASMRNQSVDMLYQQNQLLCDVLDKLHEAGDELFERLAKIDPDILTFIARNGSAYSKKKKKGVWQPPEMAELEYFGIRKDKKKVRINGEEKEVDLDPPHYRVRLENVKAGDQKNQILRATWRGGKKDWYVPYVFDTKKVYEAMKAARKERPPLEYEDEPLTLGNVDKAITRGSIVEMQVQVDSLKYFIAGSSLQVIVTSMCVDPCPAVEGNSADSMFSALQAKWMVPQVRAVPEDLDEVKPQDDAKDDADWMADP